MMAAFNGACLLIVVAAWGLWMLHRITGGEW